MFLSGIIAEADDGCLEGHAEIYDFHAKTAEPDLTETDHWYKPLWISICFIENDFLRLVINTEDTVCPS